MCASKLVFVPSMGLMGNQLVVREAEGVQSIPKPPPSYSLPLSAHLSRGVCHVTGIKRSKSSELKAARITNKGLKMSWIHRHVLVSAQGTSTGKTTKIINRPFLSVTFPPNF